MRCGDGESAAGMRAQARAQIVEMDRERDAFGLEHVAKHALTPDIRSRWCRFTCAEFGGRAAAKGAGAPELKSVTFQRRDGACKLKLVVDLALDLQVRVLRCGYLQREASDALVAALDLPGHLASVDALEAALHKCDRVNWCCGVPLGKRAAKEGVAAQRSAARRLCAHAFAPFELAHAHTQYFQIWITTFDNTSLSSTPATAPATTTPTGSRFW